jgi:hypothetical protein
VSRRRRALLAIAAALAAGGCTLRFHTLGGEPPAGPVANVAVVGAVDVRAGEAQGKGRVTSVTPFDVELDYVEFTGAAVNQLRAELARQGVATADGAPKSLEIVVMYVDVLRTVGSFSCLVDYRVTTGDGTVRGLQARRASWNYKQACREAIGEVAAETLGDPVVARYLATT